MYKCCVTFLLTILHLKRGNIKPQNGNLILAIKKPAFLRNIFQLLKDSLIQNIVRNKRTTSYIFFTFFSNFWISKYKILGNSFIMPIGKRNWLTSKIYYIYSRHQLYAYRFVAYFTNLHRFVSVPILWYCFQWLSVSVNCISYTSIFRMSARFFWSKHALLCVNYLRLTAFYQNCFFWNKNNTNIDGQCN